MLTISLKELEQDGLVQKKTHTVFPRRIEYSLTETGWSMQSMLQMMTGWGHVHKSSI